MTVTQIVVHAGRVFNHPYESYSNLKPAISITATLEPGEDPIQATKSLQAQAEQLVEDHKEHLLNSIHDLHQLTERNKKAQGLRRTIEAAQRELDGLRESLPALTVADDEDQDRHTPRTMED